MPPPIIHIDRLRLDIPGSSAAYGREVALLVAAGLANAIGLPQAGDLPMLRVTLDGVTPNGAEPPDAKALAHRIVAQALRDLARSV